MVAAAARIESSEFLLKNKLTAAAAREQSVQQKIAAIDESIKLHTPSRKPMSESRCVSNLKNEKLINVMTQSLGASQIHEKIE